MNENDKQRFDRFVAEHHERNMEIYDTLEATRGAFRAEMASEMANLTLLVSALRRMGCPGDFLEALTQTTIKLSTAVVTHHNWDPKEFAKDMEAFMEARAFSYKEKK
jgi:hypothetical protein